MKNSFLITGANSFLGKNMVKYLLNNTNTKIFITTRSKNKEFFSLTKKPNVFYLPEINLINEDDLNALVKEVNKKIKGKFNIINCVGYFPKYNYIHRISLKEAKEIFESNLMTIYGIANKFIPLLIKRKGGHFIAFSTHTQYQHYPEMVAFTSAKIAVESIISGIANEYSKYNICANSFAISTILSETEKKLKPNGDFKNWLTANEVCKSVYEFISNDNISINGNAIHLFKYSPSFFHQSYYERIKR